MARGKTTFLNMIQGRYEYKGSINVPVPTGYFPYKISGKMLGMCASDFIGELKPGCEEWKVICEFVKQFEDYSEGQKKKVLIASSLMTLAHLYIWDEPLNYIDIFTRMQLEELLLKFNPSMILVEHDIRFQEKIATRVINL